MEKILYPNHPVRCIFSGPSESGKSKFSNKYFLKIFHENDKRYMHSLSLHQDIYQKLIKCFSNCIPIHIVPNILNDEDVAVVIDEINNNNDLEKSGIEIDTFESEEELKFPQENNSYQSIVIILDELNQKEMEDPRVQVMFK